MLFNLIYNYVIITFYSGILFGILGLIVGIIQGFIEATNKINCLHYYLIIVYNPFYINYCNYFIEYTKSISYSMTIFGIIFFISGFIFPFFILFLAILYIINKYNYYSNKFTK